MRFVRLAPLLLVLAACSGQDHARSPHDAAPGVSGSTPAPAPPSHGSARIAEYVVEAFEGSKGTLWFGTMNKGVARFDGTKLTYLTERDGLCGDTVVSIAEDGQGHLWFGTQTGVCRYDGAAFTTLSNAEGHVRADGNGAIWVGSRAGMIRHDASGATVFELPFDRSAISSWSIVPGRVFLALADSKGQLWFAADGAGLMKYDGTTFTHFTKRDGLCSNTVKTMVEDAQGRLWIGCIQSFQPAMTGDGGLCVYDPSAASGVAFTTFPDVKGLHGNDIYTLGTERSGNIWIGATGVGAYRFDGAGFTLFDRTDRPDFTVNFGVQAWLEDRHGTLWFGFSGGLFRFDGDAFLHVTQDGPFIGIAPPAGS